MSSWHYVGIFVIGYCTGVYHLPNLIYEQIIDVPFMAHKMLLVCVFLILTFFYAVFIFIPLERFANEERKSKKDVIDDGHHLSSRSSNEEDEDEGRIGRWQHVLLRRRGSF